MLSVSQTFQEARFGGGVVPVDLLGAVACQWPLRMGRSDLVLVGPMESGLHKGTFLIDRIWNFRGISTPLQMLRTLAWGPDLWCHVGTTNLKFSALLKLIPRASQTS